MCPPKLLREEIKFLQIEYYPQCASGWLVTHMGEFTNLGIDVYIINVHKVRYTLFDPTRAG